MSYNKLPADYAVEFNRIREEALQPAARYAAYQALLQRACSELTRDFHTEFTSIFSSIQAIGRIYHYDVRPIDDFRRRAHALLNLVQEYTPFCQSDDERAIAAFINYFAGTQLILPTAPVKQPISQPHATIPVIGKNCRAIVSRITPHETYVRLENNSSKELQISLEDFFATSSHLTCGDLLNLVDTRIDETQTLRPLYIIYEPDYLIDVTALTGCLQPYGNAPANYLLNRLKPHVSRPSQLLGDAANLFVDVCCQATSPIAEGPDADTLFMQTMRRAFRSNLTGYLNCSAQINTTFFRDARRHFDHIVQLFNHTFGATDLRIDPDHLLLEPTIICPTLGLRGRLDMLTDDHTCIIELKSGKIDEIKRRPRRPHVLQMALYKEMVHYNLGIKRQDIRSLLLYSRYPLLFDERVSTLELRRLLELRNLIVWQERDVRKEQWDSIKPSLTVSALNTQHLDTTFFHRYLRPELEATVNPLHEADATAWAYFKAFSSFTSREQFFAKMGDHRPDSARGFAKLWTTDFTTRLNHGDVIAPLHLVSSRHSNEGIECIQMKWSGNTAILPNFSVGEQVQLYPIPSGNNAPNVCQAETLRAAITQFTGNTLTLALDNMQHSSLFFDPVRTYAIEHDYTDSLFTTCYRGLHSLLTAPTERRRLYLNQRKPRQGAPLRLSRSYGNAATDHLLLQAKRATDFYLLSGPPGCGKTNLLLRAMVEEFITTRPTDNLLLTAYTNRAVDEICAMLKTIHPVPRFTRIGNRRSTAEEHHTDLLETQFRTTCNRAEATNQWADTHIIVGTVATLGSNADLFRIKHFGMALVDEASQLLEPQLAPLLFGQHTDGSLAIDKFVFIGDERQLPAVVSQPDADCYPQDELLREIGVENLGESLFQRLLRQVKRQGLTYAYGQVETQGRMHPDVSRFANHYFYADSLRPVGLPHQTESLGLTSHTPDDTLAQFMATHRTGFVHITPGIHLPTSPKTNPAEARILTQMALTLLALYHDSGKALKPEQIGIIVPFRNQIALMRTLLSEHTVLKGITVDTVECYQGSQREVILYGTTISRPYQCSILSQIQNIDGRPIDRKLNVALTRARRQCFMVGNAELLRHNPLYACYIANNPILSLSDPAEEQCTDASDD